MPDPVPGPGEILVDVLACGVCASDLGVWSRGPAGPEPLRLGHEIVGRVARVGEPDSVWRPGDVVTGLGSPGLAQRAVLRSREALPALQPWSAALGEPLAVVEEVMMRAEVVLDGRSVAVVGLGFMGLITVQLAAVRMPSRLAGVDTRAASRGRAERLGATVFGPQDQEGLAGTFDLVFEVTGSDRGLAAAGRLVRPQGTLAVLGYHEAGPRLDAGWWAAGMTIVGGSSPDRRRTMAAMAAAIDLVRDRRVSLVPLITHRVRLNGIDRAFERMAAREPTFVKAVMVPDLEEAE